MSDPDVQVNVTLHSLPLRFENMAAGCSLPETGRAKGSERREEDAIYMHEPECIAAEGV